MLRELSILAKRRQARPVGSSAHGPASNDPAPNSDASEKSPEKASPSRISRRLSRTSSSFLSRRRQSSSESDSSTSPHASSNLLRLDRRPSRASGLSPSKSLRQRTTSSASAADKKVQPPATPPPTFPKKVGVTTPITTIDDLFKWRPTGLAAKTVSAVPLSDAAVKRFLRGGLERLPVSSNLPPVTASRVASSSLKRLQPPRLLVCHDFAGGYKQWEAAAAGAHGDDCPPDSEMWRFNHWAYVDVFVYFAHYRVTIPPVGYIQAAHRHGSLVLGTLIFENQDGTEDLLKILASFKTRAKAANLLASIAKFHGFDGWLVNVEVALSSGSTAAADLVAFVGDLTRTCRKILGPVSEVVWYDAVTRDGSLSWQNELNDENGPFFKAAGAIFTNYHWDRNAPVRSAVAAGTRRTDVFTGIDVHGRNTFGGGGFHTHIALRAIKQGGTSAAIFAPAWTVEKCPPNVSDPRQLEERFWTGPSGRFGRECVAQYFRERPVVTDLPFSTNFDPGWGPRFVRNGVVKDERRYFNMAQQQVQPSFMRTVTAGGDATATELTMSHEHVYNGSTAVKILFAFSDNRMLTGAFAVLRLLMANVPLPARLSSRITKSHEGCLKVSYDYYAQCASDPQLAANDFGLVLLFGSPPMVVLLVGKDSRWNMSTSARRKLPRIQVHDKFLDMEVCVAESDRRAFGSPLEKEEGSTGWMTRTFMVDSGLTSSQRLVEVLVVVGGPPQQPVSVRQTPLMSPSSYRSSRVASRIGSRTGSRLVSRQASRQPSRAPSPTRRGDGNRDRDELGSLHSRLDISEGQNLGVDDGRRALDADGKGDANEGETDAFGNQLLNRFRDSVGRRNYNYSLPSSRHTSQLGISSGFERRKDSAPEDMHRGDNNRDARGREGMSYRTGSRGYGGYDSGIGMLSEGSLNFDQMMMDEDMSTNAARAMSRFSSRLGPQTGGSRYGSRINSLAASRTGSIAASLAGSRSGSVVGSRAGSRTASPTRTPMRGGGGAVPLEEGVRAGLLNSGVRSRMTSGLESGTTTPSRSSSAIRELKSALMVAAGSMADATAGGDGQGGIAKVVFLGGVKIEVVEGIEGDGEPQKGLGERSLSDKRPLTKAGVQRPPISGGSYVSRLAAERLASGSPMREKISASRPPTESSGTDAPGRSARISSLLEKIKAEQARKAKAEQGSANAQADAE